MASDIKGRPLTKGDTVNLRLVITSIEEPQPDLVTGELHPNAGPVVHATLDPSDPNSPRFVFRAEHLEKA